ncbi:hypothetical protein [Pseudofulvibacter geojedonensis]|uniref:Uncharacterized protein n=1 Tax=Pseudofulvibacter geojedonensis TaxID=1123758 RepID=A0ABW3I1G6_9FLAO
MPKVGDKYLIVYLKNNPRVDYVFLEKKLPDNVDIEDDVDKFIPDKIEINFLRI